MMGSGGGAQPAPCGRNAGSLPENDGRQVRGQDQTLATAGAAGVTRVSLVPLMGETTFKQTTPQGTDREARPGVGEVGGPPGRGATWGRGQAAGLSSAVGAAGERAGLGLWQLKPRPLRTALAAGAVREHCADAAPRGLGAPPLTGCQGTQRTWGMVWLGRGFQGTSA